MELVQSIFGLVSKEASLLLDWSLAPILIRAIIPVLILVLGIIKASLKLGKYLVIGGVILLALPYVVEIIYQLKELILQIAV